MANESYLQMKYMYKVTTIVVLILLTALFTKAQSVRDNIEKAYRHPDRSKNSAKADVYIADKKRISDSIPVTRDSTLTTTKKNIRKKRNLN